MLSIDFLDYRMSHYAYNINGFSSFLRKLIGSTVIMAQARFYVKVMAVPLGLFKYGFERLVFYFTVCFVFAHKGIPKGLCVFACKTK